MEAGQNVCLMTSRFKNWFKIPRCGNTDKSLWRSFDWNSLYFQRDAVKII